MAGFVSRALAAGWTSTVAHPLRLRDLVLGSFVTFHSAGEVLDEVNEKLLRGSADVAAIAVIQRRAVADVEVVNEQLHVALESRLKIEQAKGMVAQRTGMKPADAFEVMRSHARSTNQRLKDVAGAVVGGDLDVGIFARPVAFVRVATCRGDASGRAPSGAGDSMGATAARMPLDPGHSAARPRHSAAQDASNGRARR